MSPARKRPRQRANEVRITIEASGTLPEIQAATDKAVGDDAGLERWRVSRLFGADRSGAAEVFVVK
ncbi:MAG: hypothetical protein ACRD0M_07560, partial [Acidimicrobiales bacterium]